MVDSILTSAPQVVKSDIANMIAPNNATLLPTLFAEFAVMQVTWLKIVPIAREALIGATDPVFTQAEEVLVMLSTERWR